MSFFTRGSWFSGSTLMQVAFLGTGLVLSVGSAGKSKKDAQAPVTFYDSQCRAERPDIFRQQLERYSLSCRYEGGEPTFNYVTRRKADGTTCPKGTFLHGIAIGCDGARFKAGLVPPRRRAAANLPTTAEAQAAMMKSLVGGLNRYRAAKSLGYLEWHDRLAEFAGKWALHLASLGGKRMVHSKGTGQGENVWLGSVDSFNHDAILRSWSMDEGQRAQMENPKATKIGCAFKRKGDDVIVVCRSWPPIR
jgi:hypothetical protein